MVVWMGSVDSSHSVLVVKQKGKKRFSSTYQMMKDVRITPHALQELVSKSCLGMDGIHSPSTNIHKQGEQIRLLVRTSMLTAILRTDKIKNKLKKVMVENLCFLILVESI